MWGKKENGQKHEQIFHQREYTDENIRTRIATSTLKMFNIISYREMQIKITTMSCHDTHIGMAVPSIDSTERRPERNWITHTPRVGV